MDRNTKLILNQEARKAILRGVNAIYNSVRLTFGPHGSNGLVYGSYGGSPRVTNDGVTLSDVIEPRDEAENLVANVFKNAAHKTNLKAGDATTATTIIAGKLINDVFSKISEVASIRTSTAGGSAGTTSLRKQILETSAQVCEKIKERAKKVESLEELEKIAIVSVEDEKLGKVIAGMAWEVGTDGYIDVVSGHKGEIETELIKGARFPAKVPGKAFVNNPARFEMVAQDCPVVVTNHKITNAAQVASFVQNLRDITKLVIFAPEFSHDTLVSIISAAQNKQAPLFIYPVHTPGLRTEQFEDLAICTGANFINKETNKKLENTRQEDLGFLEKLIVKDSEAREDCIVMGGKGTKEAQMKVGDKEYSVSTPVMERIKVLQSQVEETKVDSHKFLLKRRIAGLASAVGVIRVSTASDAETYYKKKKIEDAVNSSRVALEEGYVKGGGLCLKEIAEELEDSNILKGALLAPYEQLQANAESPIIITDDIIDPAKAIRLAVEHGCAVAANLITVKVIIPEYRDMNPAEGYNNIAKSIDHYAYYWAKERGLIKENEEEKEKDMWEHYQNESLNI